MSPPRWAPLFLVGFLIACMDSTWTLFYLGAFVGLGFLVGHLQIKCAKNLVHPNHLPTTKGNKDAGPRYTLSPANWCLISAVQFVGGAFIWVLFGSMRVGSFCVFCINYGGLVSSCCAILAWHSTWKDPYILPWTLFLSWQALVWFVGVGELHLTFSLWGILFPVCFFLLFRLKRGRGSPGTCLSSLKAVPKAVALVLFLTLFFHCMAYWALVSTNYFWIRLLGGRRGLGHVSKSGTLSQLDPGINLRASRLGAVQLNNLTHISELIHGRGFQFPLIAKPDECTTSSRAVDVIRNLEEARGYFVERYKAHKETGTMLQDMYKGGKEYVVFYVRFPWEKSGRLKSIGLRAQMVHFKTKDNGFKHAEYTISEADHLWSPSLLAKFDEISYNVSGFFSGRVDIKASSEAALQRGEFKVLEINFNAIGCISEKPCCCTSFHTLGVQHRWYHQPWANNLRLIRTMTFQILIGWVNIMTNQSNLWVFLHVGLPSFYTMSQRCGHHEMYFARP